MLNVAVNQRRECKRRTAYEAGGSGVRISPGAPEFHGPQLHLPTAYSIANGSALPEPFDAFHHQKPSDYSFQLCAAEILKLRLPLSG